MEVQSRTIKKILKSQGRSIQWLADEMDVSRQTVHNWDKKTQAVSWPYRLAICEKLDIHEEELDVKHK